MKFLPSFFFKNTKGFTLVELLVSLGVIAVITITTTQILVSLINSSIEVEKRNLIELNYSFVSQKLVKIIEDGTQASVNSTGDVLTVNQGSTTTCFAINSNSIKIQNSKSSCPDSSDTSYQDLVDSTKIKVIKDGTNNFFSLVSSSNPIQVRIIFKVEDASDSTKFQTLERIITLRKTFKAF